MKVETISHDETAVFDHLVNAFMAKPNVLVKEVHFSSSTNMYEGVLVTTFSAMVVYREYV